MEQNFLDPKNGGSRGLLQWFRRISKAKTPGAFHALVDKLAKKAPKAANYLRNIPPEHWVLGIFPGSRWNIFTSNHAESTNAALVHPRGQPIIHLLYALWGYVKAHRWQYSEKARQGSPGHFTPAMTSYPSGLNKGDRECHVWPGNPRGELLVTRNHLEWKVDLGGNRCSCPYWRDLELPCFHAIAAIHYRDREVRRDQDSGGPRMIQGGWTYLIPSWATYGAWQATYQELMLQVMLGGY
jgi:hypothetical protein